MKMKDRRREERSIVPPDAMLLTWRGRTSGRRSGTAPPPAGSCPPSGTTAASPWRPRTSPATGRVAVIHMSPARSIPGKQRQELFFPIFFEHRLNDVLIAPGNEFPFICNACSPGNLDDAK